MEQAIKYDHRLAIAEYPALKGKATGAKSNPGNQKHGNLQNLKKNLKWKQNRGEGKTLQINRRTTCCLKKQITLVAIAWKLQ